MFDWVGESEVCRRLLKSLDSLSNEELPNAIVRFVFDFFENVFFSPTWWDSLDIKSQEVLRRRAGYLVSIGSDINPNSLRDDGLKVVSWQVTARETNVALE